MNWQEDFRAHALESAPFEACGLLVQGQYVRCRNIHERPDKAFRIHPADMRQDAEAVCHSHPTGPRRLTDADIASQAKRPLPWHLYNLPTAELLTFLPQDAPLPLVGRAFHFGLTDCYALARDWYSRERGVELPDFPRCDGFEWRGEDPFMEHYLECGFHRVATPEHGDLILFALGSPMPPVSNHVGVYLEGDRILHHRRDTLSGEEPYGRYYRKTTRLILRYGGRDAVDPSIPTR